MTTLAEFMADDDGAVTDAEREEARLSMCDGLCDESVKARQAENDLRSAVHRLVLKWDQDADAWERRVRQLAEYEDQAEASYASGYRDALKTAAVVLGRLLGE
jgi:hypothetical protein